MNRDEGAGSVRQSDAPTFRLAEPLNANIVDAGFHTVLERFAARLPAPWDITNAFLADRAIRMLAALSSHSICSAFSTALGHTRSISFLTQNFKKESLVRRTLNKIVAKASSYASIFFACSIMSSAVSFIVEPTRLELVTSCVQGRRSPKLSYDPMIPRYFGIVKQRNGARATGLEPATSSVTGWRSNQLSYAPLLSTFLLFVHLPDRLRQGFIYLISEHNKSQRKRPGPGLDLPAFLQWCISITAKLT